MYIKITKSGPRRYVQLVESFRDGDGRVRQRTVANIGVSALKSAPTSA